MEMSMIGKVQEQLGEAGLIAVVRADGKEAAEEIYLPSSIKPYTA